MQTMNNGQLVKQPYLKTIGLIILITSVNMTGPLATDMYLPAFPTLLTEFNTTESTLNLTLVLFAITFAVGMLIFGPFSDKYGRKKILITGIIFYIIACTLCSMASNVEELIFYRILQALGGGCMVSVSTAMIKDSFEGRDREKILATVQSLGVFAPMIAPLLGAQILRFSSWHMTFLILAIFSCMSLVLAFLLKETHAKEKRYQGHALKSLSRLFVVAQNKPFIFFLLITALPSIVYMGFLAISSYIYVQYFKITETEYSIFFAINSAILIFGPVAYIRVNRILHPKKILLGCFNLIGLGGVLIILLGWISPIVFICCFAPITMGCSLVRPFAVNILLDQQESDTGTAVSLINFTNSMIGSTGMMLATVNIFNVVTRLGVIALTTAIIAICAWFIFSKSNLKLKGVDK